VQESRFKDRDYLNGLQFCGRVVVGRPHQVLGRRKYLMMEEGAECRLAWWGGIGGKNKMLIFLYNW